MVPFCETEIFTGNEIPNPTSISRKNWLDYMQNRVTLLGVPDDIQIPFPLAGLLITSAK